jgi:hypothetical protein
MDVPKTIEKAVRRPARGGLHQHTFVFKLEEIEHCNDTLDAFCDAHNVISIVFSESKGKLVYCFIFKD